MPSRDLGCHFVGCSGECFSPRPRYAVDKPVGSTLPPALVHHGPSTRVWRKCLPTAPGKGAENMHMEEIDDGDDELHLFYGQCSLDKKCPSR